MSGQEQWKVLDNTPTSRRNVRSKRTPNVTQAATNEEKTAEPVNNQEQVSTSNPTAITTTDKDTKPNAATESSLDSSNTRKTRSGQNRRGQPSNRSLRKAGEISGEEQQNKSVTQLATTTNPVNKPLEQSVIQPQTEPNQTTVVTIATVSNESVKQNNTTNVNASANTNTNTNPTTNFWTARRQQKELSTQAKKPEQSNTTSTSFQPTHSGAYVPSKVLPSAVLPTKRTPINTTKKVSDEQESAFVNAPPVAVTAPVSIAPAPADTQASSTSTSTTAPPRHVTSSSGYRPPHIRGDATVVKPPEDSGSSPRRDRNQKSNFKDRETETPSSERDRGFNRRDMGRGYSKRGGHRDYGNTRDEFHGRKRNDGDHWGSGHIHNREENKHRNESDPPASSFGVSSKQEQATNYKREATDHEVISKNNITRSQSLTHEMPVTSLKPVADSMAKTYSAPKEQLNRVVKLHGSIEQKDEKIMKIKQQMKDKVKTQPKAYSHAAAAAAVGGFQPVLSGAGDALRATFDGDLEIARQNAELVKQELKTNLNPLNPEFAPEQTSPMMDTDRVLDQPQFLPDQGAYSTEQVSGMGMYAAYDTHVPDGAETNQDGNVSMSWSFHPSDSSVYAQDIGGDVAYEMGHYPNFERHQDIGVDVGMTGGGQSNAAMSGISLASNTATGGVSGGGSGGGPPSQSPEHVPVSNTMNEAYNTQSTATMAPQSIVMQSTSGNTLGSNTFNHGGEVIPSDTQQVAMKASEAIQQNPQMFAPSEYHGNPSGMMNINSLSIRQPYFELPGVVDPNQMWSSMDDPQGILAWQQRMRAMNAGVGVGIGVGPQGQIPLQAQPFPGYGHPYNTDRGFPRRGKHRYNHQYRGSKRRWQGDGSAESHDQGNDMDSMQMRKGGKFSKRRNPKKGNFGSYRTKEQGFVHQSNEVNGIGNENEIKNNEMALGLKPHFNDGNLNPDQWQNYSTEYGSGNMNINISNNNLTNMNNNNNINGNAMMDSETKLDVNQGKEDNNNYPSTFETLTLSDWYLIIGSFSPQHLETFQNQLFQMSAAALKTFRLELPSSPIQSNWVDRVKWSQLSDFLSQAKLQHVIITSHLQTKLDVYNDQDYQELQPVAKFVSSLKCKCLTIEHSPCKITPEFIQSLPNEIVELKLLCPSIEWTVELVRALNPKLNYLASVCPNTVTIEEFLGALEDKAQKLYLCNDESSSRKLSPEDIWKLFEHVLSLELDGSLLTEIRPMAETATTKTEALIIHLKDKVPEKDFYEKYSLPKSIAHFNVCPVDPSCMMKGWNASSNTESTAPSYLLAHNHPYSNDGTDSYAAENDEKLDPTNQRHLMAHFHHANVQSQVPMQAQKVEDAIREENKGMIRAPEMASIASEQVQSNPSAQVSSNTGKKMSFKEKLQSGPKVAKKSSTLRIGGQTQQ